MLIERIEYYVRYTSLLDSKLDTTPLKYSSRIFLTKKEAEDFAKSMQSRGMQDIEVKEVRYYYETGKN